MPSMTPHEGGGAFPGGVNGMVPPGVFGGGSLFGDGTYSGNIVQDGEVLQPQTVNWPPDQNTGGSTGSTNDNYTRVDISWSFPAGETVTHLGIYGTGAAFTALLYIMRRNSAGNYTNVASITATVAATAGWQFFPLPTAFAVPADAYTYHVGSYSVHQVRYNNVATLQASNPGGQFVVGSTGALKESSDATHMVAARYEQRALDNCIYITGPATVAPDATTGAAVWMAHNVVLIGASASLSAATNCKGLLGFVNGLVALRGGAHLHMDKLGKAGNFGNLTVLDLVPASIKRKLKNDLAAYVVLGEGASGGLGVPTYGEYLSGNPGYAAGAMQSGGGGSGQSGTYSGYGTGKGGKGGPCCGGAGSGGNINNYANAPDAGDYGGPGGAGLGGLPNNTFYASGGAGDPVGITNCGNPGEGAGGGLLMLFTPALSIASGCVVSSDGAKGGGTGNGCSGGSAGGGCICIVTAPGGLSNAGTIRASGGAGVVGATGLSSGPGGVGSVNTFPIAT